MAKRTQRVAANAAAAATGTGSSGNPGDAARNDAVLSDAGHAANFVVFDLAGGKFGFQLGNVGEIIRVPNLARMPLAPRSLVGLANLHGVVLPVVDLRQLLGFPGAPLDEAARVIVIARGAPVGYVVDRIDGLVALPAGRLEKDDAGAGSIDPSFLDGIIKGAEGESTVKILNPTRILRDEFSQLGVSAQRAPGAAAVSAAGDAASATTVGHRVSLVSFELGGQEYALPLDRVEEIIQLPEHISELARSETAVLGVVTLRDRLLPLVSLRALLGLPADSGRKEPGKVVVLPMGGGARKSPRSAALIRANAWSPCFRRTVCSGPIWCGAFCRSRVRRTTPRQARPKGMQWPTSNSLSSGLAIRTTDYRLRRWARSPGRRSASPACPRLRRLSMAL
jgi:purine-binding chemotaxis protein CheW